MFWTKKWKSNLEIFFGNEKFKWEEKWIGTWFKLYKSLMKRVGKIPMNESSFCSIFFPFSVFILFSQPKIPQSLNSWRKFHYYANKLTLTFQIFLFFSVIYSLAVFKFLRESLMKIYKQSGKSKLLWIIKYSANIEHLNKLKSTELPEEIDVKEKEFWRINFKDHQGNKLDELSSEVIFKFNDWNE
jgi:hypothetical protein